MSHLALVVLLLGALDILSMAFRTAPPMARARELSSMWLTSMFMAVVLYFGVGYFSGPQWRVKQKSRSREPPDESVTLMRMLVAVRASENMKPQLFNKQYCGT